MREHTLDVHVVVTYMYICMYDMIVMDGTARKEDYMNAQHA